MSQALTKRKAYNQLKDHIMLPDFKSKACTLESLLLMRDYQQYFAVTPNLSNKLPLPVISLNCQVLHYIVEIVCWYQYTKLMPFESPANKSFYYMMLNQNNFDVF